MKKRSHSLKQQKGYDVSPILYTDKVIFSNQAPDILFLIETSNL